MSYSLTEHIEDSEKLVHFLKGIAEEYPEAIRYPLVNGTQEYFTMKGVPTDITFVSDKEGRVYGYAYFEYRGKRLYVTGDKYCPRGMSQWDLIRSLKKYDTKVYTTLVRSIADL